MQACVFFILDYIHKDGAVVSFELAVPLHMACVPEYQGDYNNVQCSWKVNNYHRKHVATYIYLLYFMLYRVHY